MTVTDSDSEKERRKSQATRLLHVGIFLSFCLSFFLSFHVSFLHPSAKYMRVSKVRPPTVNDALFEISNSRLSLAETQNMWTFGLGPGVNLTNRRPTVTVTSVIFWNNTPGPISNTTVQTNSTTKALSNCQTARRRLSAMNLYIGMNTESPTTQYVPLVFPNRQAQSSQLKGRLVFKLYSSESMNVTTWILFHKRNHLNHSSA